MASDHEHALIKAVQELTAKAAALPANVAGKQGLVAAVADLRNKLGLVDYHVA